VIKRKMSNWKLKRAGTPQSMPAQPAAPDAITIVAATKTGPASRKKQPTKP
jgi:hypothetical protein